MSWHNSVDRGADDAFSHRHIIRFLSISSGLVLCLHAEMPPEQARLSGAAAIRTFPAPRPQDTEAAINEHKTLLRTEIAIDPITKVRFYEEPRSWEVYNSSVSIQRQGMPIQVYNIGRLIHHQALGILMILELKFALSLFAVLLRDVR